MDDEGQAPLPTPPLSEPPDDPNAVLLIDAKNGFNELGRKAALWTLFHRWSAGARFASNCYRHACQLLLRRIGQTCLILLSQEGVTQGDPLSMIVYGVALLPLSQKLRHAEPMVLQPWYADDMAMVGPCSGIARCTQLLERLGPLRGYFPEPSKSILICKPAAQDDARRALRAFDFKYVDGSRYLGGFIGTDEARTAWLQPQLDDWVYGIEQLSKVAARFPPTAYAGLAKSLQREWMYTQRVIPNAGPAFAPVEAALADTFLPALLQEPAAPTTALRPQLALPVRRAGLGVPDPQRTAKRCFTASRACTGELIRSLRVGDDLDIQAHAAWASLHRRRLQKGEDQGGGSCTQPHLPGSTPGSRAPDHALPRDRGLADSHAQLPQRH
jgi:hypothetical protein